MINVGISMSSCSSFCFVLLVLSCMLFGVDVVMVFHERIPLRLGVLKELGFVKV
jgi:hypothetical protein